MKRLIYCLKCPFTKEIHYVGKSSSGMIRPLSHLNKSHSDKINEWVENLKLLGYKPEVEILEYVPEECDLEEREIYYISKFYNKNHLLMNLKNISPKLINSKLDNLLNYNEYDLSHISKFIKERRKQCNLTQTELSDKSGVALTVIRKIEQNNFNINIDGLLTILSMFGHTLDIKKIMNDN